MISPRIILFGATGYTGHLVAEAMVRRGLKPILAGRNEAKLKELAGKLGGLETRCADRNDLRSLAKELIGKGDVLASTVGPFTFYGEAALEAAAGQGAHYLDSTGEPGFIRKVFQNYGPRAQAAGVAFITACGYDYVPGNCAAAAALRSAGPEAVRVDVGCFVTGGFAMSQGTKASTRAAAVEPGLMWEAGRLVEQTSGLKLRTFAVGGKEKPGISISSSEHYSLPRLYPQLQEVNVYLGWFGKRSAAMQRAAKIQAAAMKLPGVKKIMRAAIARSLKSEGRGPDKKFRETSGSLIVAESFDASGNILARAELIGADGYSFTAEMLAWMADSIIQGKLKQTGAVGPVEAFGLDELIAGCRQAGLELRLSSS